MGNRIKKEEKDIMDRIMREVTNTIFSDEGFRKHTMEKYGVCPKDFDDRETFEKLFATDEFKRAKREYEAGTSFGKKFENAKAFEKAWREDPSEVKMEVKVYSNRVEVEAPKMPTEMTTLAIIQCVKSVLSIIEDDEAKEFVIGNICQDLGLFED